MNFAIFRRKALTLVRLLYCRIIFPFYKRNGSPKVLSIEDTINLVIKKNLSVARFGDSEYLYMVGTNDGLQKSSDKLQEKLKQTLNSCDENLLVCMLDYLDMHNKTCYSNLSSAQFYVKTYTKIKPYVLKNRVYGNSNMTRFYINSKDKSKCAYYFDLCKKIWENKDVIIFEGVNTRFGVSNDLLSNAKSIKRVLCPSKQAFDVYDEIIQYALTLERCSILLFALGVTATVAAYDLTTKGYRVIDIGNLDIEYEWFKLGVEHKVRIKGKQVSEVPGGTLVENIDNIEYEQQIIHKIKC